MTHSEFLANWNDERPYVEAHTSGSTGKPKDIRLLKTDMLVSARATNAFFGINSSSFLFCPLSLDYIAGKMMAVRAYAASCLVDFIEPSNNVMLPPRTIDLLPVVPSQLDSLLSRPDALANVRNLLIGGAAPSPQHCTALAGLGINAYVSYGMTETCSHVALASTADAERIYHAMPGISFSTTADSRLIINAPVFSFGRMETNDIVELIDRQSFRWIGRADNVINSGGIKLFAEELEALYAPALGSTPFYVTSVADSKWGNAVMLVAETTPEHLDRIRHAVETIVADHRRRPKHYRAVATLPRTSTGKVRRE